MEKPMDSISTTSMTTKKSIGTKLKILIKKPLTWLCLLILTILITYLGNLLIDKWRNKDFDDSKYVAVIVSTTDKGFTIPIEFKNGFGENKPLITSKSQKIEIRMEDDQYSVQQAKIVADKLIADQNCILIIGNSNSDLTEITLNSILSSNSKPSFILPIATADNLLEKSKSEEYYSILRMVPNNQNQAMMIKRFIFNKIGSKAKVALLVDEENQAYSNNLSKNVVNEIISEDGNVVLNHSYGNNSRFIPEYEILKRNNILPDVIVYTGVSSNGMLLIEELKALQLKIPVIFTDGCTVKILMEKAKKLLDNDAYFLSAVSKSENTLQPTYEPIGKDAHSLTEVILNSIHGAITRDAVSNYIAKNKGTIVLNSGSAGLYAFDEEGNNKVMDFKVYTYQNGILTEVKGIK